MPFRLWRHKTVLGVSGNFRVRHQNNLFGFDFILGKSVRAEHFNFPVLHQINGRFGLAANNSAVFGRQNCAAGKQTGVV